MAMAKIAISGLKAGADIGHLEKALEAVPGVDAVELDPAAGRAEVTHHGAEPGKMVAALRSMGYEARVD